MSNGTENGGDKDKKQNPLHWAWASLIGVYFIAAAVVLVYLLYAVWPDGTTPTEGAPPSRTDISLFWDLFDFDVTPDQGLFLVVALAGALGSYVHIATSFADFTGGRRLFTSWVWWYILRIPIGAALALVFYFAIRGGLLFVNAETDEISAYGMAAIAGLVGMFSKQATDKLKELFDTLFRTEKGDERSDKLRNPQPTLSAIDPENTPAESTGIIVTAKGSDFVQESVVRFGGKPRETTYHSTAKLSAKLKDEDTAQPGTFEVTVFSPEPGGGSSEPKTFTVTEKVQETTSDPQGTGNQ